MKKLTGLPPTPEKKPYEPTFSSNDVLVTVVQDHLKNGGGISLTVDTHKKLTEAIALRKLPASLEIVGQIHGPDIQIRKKSTRDRVDITYENSYPHMAWIRRLSRRSICLHINLMDYLGAHWDGGKNLP